MKVSATRLAIAFLLTLSALTAASAVGVSQEKPTTGSLKGSVENEKSKPVANVKVRAISRHTDRMVAEVATDEQGKFVFQQLPSGRYALVFYSPEYQQAVLRSIEVKAGRETEIEKPVRLQRVELYAVLHGATFDPSGFLLPGVRLVLERIPIEKEEIKSLKLEQVSNSSGEFAFRLPAEQARYRLKASMSGYHDEVQIVDIGGAERRHIAVQMKAKAKEK